MEAETNNNAAPDDRKIQAFINRVNSLNNIYNPSDAPRILYHYTDFAGLQGMLNNHNLWATSKHEAFSEEKEWRIIALDPPVKNLNFSFWNR